MGEAAIPDKFLLNIKGFNCRFFNKYKPSEYFIYCRQLQRDKMAIFFPIIFSVRGKLIYTF